jgi:hypothetical protein
MKNPRLPHEELNRIRCEISLLRAKLKIFSDGSAMFEGESDITHTGLECHNDVSMKYEKLICVSHDLEEFLRKTNSHCGELRIKNNILKSKNSNILLIRHPEFYTENLYSVTSSISSTQSDGYGESEKFISFKHGFIYFSVPKVASQSMIRALKKYCRDSDYLHTNKSFSKLFELSPEIADFFKFSVVRHPYSRLVSCYIDKILNFNFKKKKMFENRGMETLPRSFVEFVDFVTSPKCEDLTTDIHLASQSFLLSSTDGALLLDAAVHLENFDEELAQLFEIMKLPLLHVAKIKNQRAQHLADLGLDPEIFIDDFFRSAALEQRISLRYARDYSFFSYDPLETTE